MGKIKYNSPVVLTFSIICIGVYFASEFFGEAIRNMFTLSGNFRSSNPADLFSLFSHCIGHANRPHLIGNMTYILLLGPMIEEKYGGNKLLTMILITALCTGLLNVIFFNTGLLGASGIVFMLIILSSFTNIKTGEIPLTFILIALIFLGQEIVKSFENNNISEFAHIAGGIAGSLFGFIGKKK